jgi:methionine biosynthesis protein MetW
MSVTETSGVRRFEDHRWSGVDQASMWRHRVALELVRTGPVLDVGGGDGLLLRMLRERGHEDLRLVDISPVAVEKARQAGIAAELGDLLESLPFESDSFGTACALDVLEHLLEPLPALRELARVGREVVIAVPNFSHLKGRLTMLAGRVPFQSRPARGHSYWMNEHVFRTLIADAGLRIEAWRNEPSTRLGGVGSRLAERFPNLFAVSFAARLVKTE